MKKKLIALFAMLILLFQCSTAFAASFQATTDPQVVTAPGKIKIRFSVTNDSNSVMRDITVSGHGVGSSGELSKQEIQPGAALGFTISSVSITEDMLGEPLVYSITWSEGGQAKSQDVTVAIGSAQQAADMTAARTASKSSGKEGDKITLTYALKNPGSGSITDITVKDSIAGNSAITNGLSLAPGASQNVTYEYTLGKQDAISQPTITYKLNGETKTLGLEPMTLTIANVHLQVEVTQADPTLEGTLFTLSFLNDGNQLINDIIVSDELGSKVNADKFVLEPGKEKTLSFLVSTTTLRNISFTIKGKDAMGQPYENSTKSFEARPYVDPANIKISLVAQPVDTLSDTGRIIIRFLIQNDSSVDMTNAVISEEQLGNIINRDVIPLGETIEEEELIVGAGRELVFTLTAVDPSGTQHTSISRLTAAMVPVVTPDPNPTQTPATTDDPEQEKGGNALVTVLIVLAVLMTLAGAALIALSIYERKRNRKEEVDDYDAFEPKQKAQRHPIEQERDLKPPPRYQQQPSEVVKRSPAAPMPKQDAVERPARQPARPVEEETITSQQMPPQKQYRATPEPPAQPAKRTYQPMHTEDYYAQRREEDIIPRQSAPDQPAEAWGQESNRAQSPQAPRQSTPEQDAMQKEPQSTQVPQHVRNRVHRVRPTDEQ